MFSKAENGTWTGLVGSLVAGGIDISVAAMTMTTEREEGKNFPMITMLE